MCKVLRTFEKNLSLSLSLLICLHEFENAQVIRHKKLAPCYGTIYPLNFALLTSLTPTFVVH